MIFLTGEDGMPVLAYFACEFCETDRGKMRNMSAETQLEKTSLDRGRTDHISVTHDLDL